MFEIMTIGDDDFINNSFEFIEKVKKQEFE